MERIVRAQALSDPKAAEMNAPRKIMEINPEHILIKELNRRIKENKDDETAGEIATLLYETSAITSGFPIHDPALLVTRMLKMMTKSMQDQLPQEVVEEMQKAEPIKAPPVEAQTPKAKSSSSDDEHDE